jgi:catechol 2,3-dioxygenase-like lactoylglutathione lyase family enzyme
MDRPTHAGLRHLALNARDLAAMKRFYVDMLGFAVEWEPDADNVYLSSGTDNLALHRAGGHVDPNVEDDLRVVPRPDAGALDHLGLIVRSADDVDRWAAFLESRGIALDAQPKTHRDGARSCFFSDPDGNKVQIIHHPPISQKI